MSKTNNSTVEIEVNNLTMLNTNKCYLYFLTIHPFRIIMDKILNYLKMFYKLTEMISTSIIISEKMSNEGNHRVDRTRVVNSVKIHPDGRRKKKI